MKQLNQQLAEEAAAQQNEARLRICHQNKAEALESWLKNFKTAVSMGSFQDAWMNNRSARIANDPMEQADDDLASMDSPRDDGYYMNDDLRKCEQEWQASHQRDLADVQQQMQSQLHQQQLWFQKELS